MILQALLAVALAAADGAPNVETRALEDAARTLTTLSDVQVFMLAEAHQGAPARQSLPDLLRDVGLDEVQAFLLTEAAQGKLR